LTWLPVSAILGSKPLMSENPTVTASQQFLQSIKLNINDLVSESEWPLSAVKLTDVLEEKLNYLSSKATQKGKAIVSAKLLFH